MNGVANTTLAGQAHVRSAARSRNSLCDDGTTALSSAQYSYLRPQPEVKPRRHFAIGGGAGVADGRGSHSLRGIQADRIRTVLSSNSAGGYHENLRGYCRTACSVRFASIGWSGHL